MEIFEQNGRFGLKDDNGDVVLPAKFYKNFVEEVKDLPFQELLQIKLVEIQLRYKLQPNGTYFFSSSNGKQGFNL